MEVRDVKLLEESIVQVCSTCTFLSSNIVNLHDSSSQEHSNEDYTACIRVFVNLRSVQCA